MDVWCVGSTGGSTGFIGKLYKTSIGTLVGIDDYKNNIPSEFQLYQNFPNPFNPTTKIKYTIPDVETRHASSLQMVTVKVYDVLGNEITTLVNESQAAGSYEVEFDGSKIPSGVYFYQLKAGQFIETKKMVLLK